MFIFYATGQSSSSIHSQQQTPFWSPLRALFFGDSIQSYVLAHNKDDTQGVSGDPKYKQGEFQQCGNSAAANLSRVASNMATVDYESVAMETRHGAAQRWEKVGTRAMYFVVLSRGEPILQSPSVFGKRDGQISRAEDNGHI
ncbi:hypothetical protein NPIL_578181 [Nephila pilipes]|uniref:Uncharacterized protein n=1 Tax=Nephila pilipes TaxID=299642 RepID=A0A8X6P8X1_NEPPI|nr:hypothetical protein NPIL_578181 [Nephila pilipes]